MDPLIMKEIERLVFLSLYLQVQRDFYKTKPIPEKNLKYILPENIPKEKLERIAEKSYKIIYSNDTPQTYDYTSYICYARTSSMNQFQNKSLISQQKSASNYADDNNGILKAVYIDHSISGDDEQNRFALQLLKLEAENEDILLVYDNDRLGRTAHEIESTKEELLKRNVKTITLADNLSNDTIAGRTLGGVKSVLAQSRKESIRERTENDMGLMSRDGTLKTCPYGYRSKLDPTDPKGRRKILVEDPTEQKIIVKIVEIFNKNKNWSYRKLCNYLDDNPKTFPKREGTQHWYVQTVKTILKREGIDLPEFNPKRFAIKTNEYDELLRKGITAGGSNNNGDEYDDSI